MKHRIMIALAGAAAMIAAPSVHGVPTITADVNFTNSFLLANQLISATIRVSGFETGTSVRGIVGTDEHPWNVSTSIFNSVPFFNIDTVDNPGGGPPLFSDGMYAAPSNNAQLNSLTGNGAQWDSGLLGSVTSSSQPNPNNFGIPTDLDPDDDIGQFGMFSAGGNSDVSIAPASWVGTPNGVPVGEATNFRVMRLTWRPVINLTVRFVLLMENPNVAIPMTIIVPVPSPGPLALLAMAAIARPGRRRA